MKRKMPLFKCSMVKFAIFISIWIMALPSLAQISVNIQNRPLRQVLKEVEKVSEYRFFYNESLAQLEKNTTLNATNATIDFVMQQLLSETDLSYRKAENNIIVLVTKNSANEAASADEPGQSVVRGRILDVDGQPVIGATIVQKNNNAVGTITDIDGNFSILVPPNATLLISYIGYTPQEIQVAGRNVLNIIMQEDVQQLEELIVTGYQTISRERATGAFAVISPSTLKDKMQTDIISRLEGQVAGLVQQGNNISIRGITSLRGGSEPLIVVDGMPFEGNIQSINPSIIQNITILKDAAAASIYGARAANGVIVISTREGSLDGKTRVSYNGSIKLTPTPDFEYLNLMNSEELVALQVYGFGVERREYENLNPRYALNPVEELLFKHKSQLISDSELAQGISRYSALDNRAQIKDFYLRTGALQQHNLSLAGGNNRNRYIVSVNYTGNKGNSKYTQNERLGFTLRNDMEFFSWLNADLGVAGSFTKDSGDSGMGNALSMYRTYPSYFMLRDESGNPLNLPQSKSQQELDRLKSIGLKDETYSPIRNRTEENYMNRDNYYRVHFGLNFKLQEGLNLAVKYQTENSSYKNRRLYSKDSYTVRNMINEAAQYNEASQSLTLNVPEGGQLRETRGDSHSYTFRTQLNYQKELDKHYITALAGAERRLVKETYTNAHYMGYDDNSLGFKPINPLILSPISGTESLGGSFNYVYTGNNSLYHIEDRYVSFYGNASYTYDDKYNITGSIRVDQSNLFGTDPKFQYRPLWSLGASWDMARETFMSAATGWLNRLNLRLTYGIGGNVPKEAGPYLTLYSAEHNSWVNDFGSEISNPPNPSLRWEKTATTNLGLDFAFTNRVDGSIDYYYKHTTDLLAYRDADPTLGWDQLLLNYGSMYNRGIELNVNSSNIVTPSFQWETSFNFSYNKNKLIDVDDSNVNVFDYTGGDTSAKGYPAGAIFSYRFAGLSPQDGSPGYYNSENEVSSYIGSIDALTFSGTNVPKYTGALTNRLSYKNIDLSLMFVYYGGHVMRAEAAPYLSKAPTTNINREILNVWRQPGDEERENVSPAFTGVSLYTEDQHQWHAADKHVVNAGFVRLRDVALTYNFDKSSIAGAGMESLALMLQIQNPWTVWRANNKKLDPETMSTRMYGWGTRTFPTPTTFTVGISANF